MQLINRVFHIFQRSSLLVALPIGMTQHVCVHSSSVQKTPPESLVEDCGPAQSILKKITAFVAFLMLFQFATAQEPSQVYWVQLKDKSGSIYSLNTPSDFLSQKAIERRLRQNIAISIRDLPLNEAYTNTIKATDVTILAQSKWLNSLTISCADTNTINTIVALPFVTGVKKIETTATNKQIKKFEIAASPIGPSIEKSSRASALSYGYSFKQADQINADCLHDMGFQGEGMTIAVFDAGFFDVHILPAFDSLRINNHLLGTRDFVTGDTMVFEDFPHGMNVLSCMAANLPGLLVGTAPKADYWLLRTEDANSETLIEEFYWLEAAEFADSVGVDVINSSLGYNYFDNSADDHTYADMDGNTTIITQAADMAAATGMMVVTSAGNYGAGPWYKITAPGDADSALTVGAVDSLGIIAPLSSRGPTFDGRIKPNTVARGLNAVCAANSGGVMYANGTSFSSPITAGAVACLWQSNPSATNMDLIAAIEQSAHMNSNPDTIMGYGIPDFCAARTILTGIDKPQIDNDKLLVFPNPFENELEIFFYTRTKQSINISIHDLYGRELFYSKKYTNNLPTIKLTETLQLSKGVYLLRVATSNEMFYQKIIKSN